MATNIAIRPEEGGSFLLQLLHYAGWSLQVRDGATVRVHAARAGVEVDVAGASFPEAAGIAFARAMRSGHRRANEG